MGIQTGNNDWYPAKREYDLGIKEKQWEQLVVDESIFTKNSLVTFACIQNATSGTCAGMQNNTEEVPTFTTQMSGKPASGLRTN